MTDLRTVVDNTKPGPDLAAAERFARTSFAAAPACVSSISVTVDVPDREPVTFGIERGGFEHGPERVIPEGPRPRLSTLPEAIHNMVMRTKAQATPQADGHSDAIDQAVGETQIFGGPEINTPCPACGLPGLFVGKDGNILCGVAGCKSTSLAATIEQICDRALDAEKKASQNQLTLKLLRLLFTHPSVPDSERVAAARGLLMELSPAEPEGR